MQLPGPWARGRLSILEMLNTRRRGIYAVVSVGAVHRVLVFTFILVSCIFVPESIAKPPLRTYNSVDSLFIRKIYSYASQRIRLLRPRARILEFQPRKRACVLVHDWSSHLRLDIISTHCWVWKWWWYRIVVGGL